MLVISNSHRHSFLSLWEQLDVVLGLIGNGHIQLARYEDSLYIVLYASEEKLEVKLPSLIALSPLSLIKSHIENIKKERNWSNASVCTACM